MQCMVTPSGSCIHFVIIPTRLFLEKTCAPHIFSNIKQTNSQHTQIKMTSHTHTADIQSARLCAKLVCDFNVLHCPGAKALLNGKYLSRIVWSADQHAGECSVQHDLPTYSCHAQCLNEAAYEQAQEVFQGLECLPELPGSACIA